jgi:hypothetical protein
VRELRRSKPCFASNRTVFWQIRRWKFDRSGQDTKRALQHFERELIALGGEFDCKLADALAMVERTFPWGSTGGGFRYSASVEESLKEDLTTGQRQLAEQISQPLHGATLPRRAERMNQARPPQREPGSADF